MDLIFLQVKLIQPTVLPREYERKWRSSPGPSVSNGLSLNQDARDFRALL
jgi:hypothetical protein